jgi:beta-phosphoglucomutase family hydrolase
MRAAPQTTSVGARLGLPPAVRACLFDLDGVLTHTTELHAEAWKQMFDAFLRRRAEAEGTPFTPFGPDDYLRYVDGKPRAAGVASFLAARGIELPNGEPDDPPGEATVHALGNRKNELVLALIDEAGVDVYEGSLDYVQAVRDAGLLTAVVSSSANCREVLGAAGIAPLFEVVVDGVTVARDGLRGKPAPDAFLAAARALGTPPGDAAVFEDAIAGVEAGRAGRFGFVVGVDRADQRDQLAEAGADIVVADLAELLEVPR